MALSGTRRHGKIGSGFPADKRRGCLDPSFLLGKKTAPLLFRSRREREMMQRKGIVVVIVNERGMDELKIREKRIFLRLVKFKISEGCFICCVLIIFEDVENFDRECNINSDENLHTFVVNIRPVYKLSIIP